jgi:hypothetical protein
LRGGWRLGLLGGFGRLALSGCGGRLKQIAKGGACAEEAGADRVRGEMQEVGDFGIAELLEFAEEEDFAVHGVEFFDGAADPEAGFGGVLLRGIGDAFWMAEEGGAESAFAAVGAQDFEGDGVEVGAKEGAGLVTGGGAEEDQEGFLREFLGVMGIGSAPAEEAVDGLFVTPEEFVEGFAGAFGESEHEVLVAAGDGWVGGGGRRVVHGGARESLRV